ncbi:MAG: hypothetical protein WBI07_00235 [Mobilitalea sp.]
MFVIGETKSNVHNGKVAMPKEYRLKKRKVKGKWKDSKTLYLSDSDSSLNYIAGKDGEIFVADVDYDDRLIVPMAFENSTVNIKGCISTIELFFK